MAHVHLLWHFLASLCDAACGVCTVGSHLCRDKTTTCPTLVSLIHNVHLSREKNPITCENGSACPGRCTQSKRNPSKERCSPRSLHQQRLSVRCRGDLHGICWEWSEAGLLRPLPEAEDREKDLDHILVPFIVGCFL